MNNCSYCILEDSTKQLEENLFVCDKCLFLLNQREYGIRLVKGHLISTNRGLFRKKDLENHVQKTEEVLNQMSVKRKINH